MSGILGQGCRTLEGKELNLVTHPNYIDKKGVGIAYSCGTAPEMEKNTFGYCIERVDGSEVDFSYKECITPCTKRGQFQKACRSAVVDRIVAFRRANADQKYCALTGDLLINPEVDHIYHFYKIVNDFIKKFNIDDFNNISYTSEVDTGICIEEHFMDSNLRNNFAEYHRSVATLRIVNKKANSERSNKVNTPYQYNKHMDRGHNI